MLCKTQWKARDVAKNSPQSRHLEQLERELKENPCRKLEEHILRLKVAWGRACRSSTDPKQTQAA